jgi:hypothetical protein
VKIQCQNTRIASTIHLNGHMMVLKKSRLDDGAGVVGVGTTGVGVAAAAA